MICYPSPLTSRWSSVDSWCSLQYGRPARSTTGTSSLRNRRRSCRHPTITVIDTATQYTIGIGATALWDPDIIVSQGSVAAYARCGGVFNIHLTANLPSNLPMKKKFLNRLRFDRIMVMSLWPRFLAHPVGIRATTLWDPWDASPPTLEIVGTKCIFGPLQLLQPAVIFRWALREAYTVLPQTSLLNLRGKERRVGTGMGETSVEL